MKFPLIHPDENRPLHHGLRLHFVPNTAPVTEHICCWARNLWGEWYAAMTDRQIDHFRRIAMVLGILLIIASFYWLNHMADLTGNSTYIIYRSERSGQIIKVLDPKGRQVQMSEEDIQKLRHKENIRVR